MNWHTVTVPFSDLAAALTEIERVHGTLTNCKPKADGIHLTWATTSGSCVPC